MAIPPKYSGFMPPNPSPMMAPGAHPMMAPGAPPMMAPGAPPMMAPGAPPMMAPGAQPMMAPGAHPMMAPGAPPMMAPGAPPMMAPGAPPMMAPGAQPMGQPGTYPMPHAGVPQTSGVYQPGQTGFRSEAPAVNNQEHLSTQSTQHGGTTRKTQQTPISRAAKLLYWFSLAQIILACVAIVCDSATIGLVNNIDFSDYLYGGTSYSYTYTYTSRRSYRIGRTTFSGSGIWSGAWILLSAGFGVGASKSFGNKCLKVTHMVLSIITSVEVWAIIISASAAISQIQDNCFNYNSYSCPEDGQWSSILGLQVFILICGLLVFAFSIVTTACAGRNMTCCGTPSPRPQPTAMQMVTCNPTVQQASSSVPATSVHVSTIGNNNSTSTNVVVGGVHSGQASNPVILNPSQLAPHAVVLPGGLSTAQAPTGRAPSSTGSSLNPRHFLRALGSLDNMADAAGSAFDFAESIGDMGASFEGGCEF